MASKRSLRTLWLIPLGLLLAIAGVAIYRAQPLLSPEPVVSAPLDPGCDLRSGPCRARFPDGGELTFEIMPRVIPVLVPLQVRVEAEGLEARGMEVDFAGVDMNMGFNRIALTATGKGRYEGEGMLPTCVRNRMLWEAKVLVKTPSGLIAAPFRFETRSR